MIRRPPRSTLFPYTTLFRSHLAADEETYRAECRGADHNRATAYLMRSNGMIPGDVDETLRSEERTSELQSRQYLVCRLLLEKKKHIITTIYNTNTSHRSILY